MFICIKSKYNRLRGAITIPKKEDLAFNGWKSENNKVISWLINSMTNTIGKIFQLYSIAKETWNTAKEPYLSSESTTKLIFVEKHSSCTFVR